MSEYSTVRQLKELDPSQSVPFRGVFLLKRKNEKTARNGNPFLSMELADNGGGFNANCFSDSNVYSVCKDLPEGSILRVVGHTEYYQDRFSPRLHEAETLTEAEAEAEGLLDALVERPPEEESALWAVIAETLEQIGHTALRETVRRILEDNEAAFRKAPAAIQMHHAYRHGLLEHTAHMARAGRALLPVYPEVDGDLALAGILVHDIGKLEEYEGALAAKVSRTGTLQGHVVLGFRTVRRAALQCKLNDDLTERLEHIVLSHQGEKAWGAAAMAATPEAVFVSMIDNLDAKMGMVQRVLRNTADDESFSEYLPGLQARVLTTPPEKSGTSAGSE